MKKKIFFSIILLCILNCAGAYAQIVSQEQAQQMAENFYHIKSEEISQLEVRTLTHRLQPTLYAFSFHNSWVLIAGDQRVPPILAYSDINGGKFPDNENMPPATRYMIDWYSEQIEELRKDSTIKESNPLWTSLGNVHDDGNRDYREVIVSPLLIKNGFENVWKQDGNNDYYLDQPAMCYNKFCPAVQDATQNCSHAIVGCVAVAMAQIMWYWQWPNYLVVKDDNNNKVLRHYDWNIMPYQLTNESNLEEVDMVANLLHDVGVAVEMEYGCSSSGADPDDVAPALRNIFGYDANNRLPRYPFYNDNTWFGFLKTELSALRPVLYDGKDSDGEGHLFVIDGYNSNDQFHINYGWGGYCNGYFYLGNLAYGFNYNQSVILGISPDYPSCSSTTISPRTRWDSIFVVQNGGGITIGDRTIPANGKGKIFSQDYIRLTEGFHIVAGADVQIGIRDMHCDLRREMTGKTNESAHNMPQKQNPSSPSSSARKILRNGQVLIERSGHTYTVIGALVNSF